MSWLATWFIFELVWVGAAPDLSEPQAFKNGPLLISAVASSVHKHPKNVFFYLYFRNPE